MLVLLLLLLSLLFTVIHDASFVFTETLPFIIFQLSALFSISSTIPSWLAWIQYISWFHYANEALTINQWEDYTGIECDQNTVVSQKQQRNC